jgi:hypothetical protein
MVSMDDDSVAVGLHSREELFLKSRQQRTFVKKSLESDPDSDDDIQSRRLFWTNFKRYCHDWKERLQQAIQAFKISAANNSSEQEDMSFRDEQKLILVLERFQDELNELRRFCLQSKEDSKRSNNALSPILSHQPNALPLADLRSLHRDFTALQTQLDGIRKEVLPHSEKRRVFVFRKYRRYLQQQQSTSPDEMSLPRLPETKRLVVPPPKQPFPLFLCDAALEDYQHAVIVLQGDGTVEVIDSDASMLGSSSQTKTNPTKITSAILVIRNVRHCTIEWYVTCFPCLFCCLFLYESHHCWNNIQSWYVQSSSFCECARLIHSFGESDRGRCTCDAVSSYILSH